VRIKHWARPLRLLGRDGVLTAVEFAATRQDAQASAQDNGEKFIVAADMVFKAIGQMLIVDALDGNANVLEMSAGRIAVDAQGRTSIPGVWAGGDCVAGGQDLTVVAVEDGKRAALSIDQHLREYSKTGVHDG
jgi:glutamate synthase (NADPH/NADH) small chain